MIFFRKLIQMDDNGNIIFENDKDSPPYIFYYAMDFNGLFGWTVMEGGSETRIKI
jgi:hypothetical protein